MLTITIRVDATARRRARTTQFWRTGAARVTARECRCYRPTAAIAHDADAEPACTGSWIPADTWLGHQPIWNARFASQRYVLCSSVSLACREKPNQAFRRWPGIPNCWARLDELLPRVWQSWKLNRDEGQSDWTRTRIWFRVIELHWWRVSPRAKKDNHKSEQRRRSFYTRQTSRCKICGRLPERNYRLGQSAAEPTKSDDYNSKRLTDPKTQSLRNMWTEERRRLRRTWASWVQVSKV